MDGSEGRLGFGGQEEAPAGSAPPKALGDTGGWDPDHIETVREALSSGFVLRLLLLIEGRVVRSRCRSRRRSSSRTTIKAGATRDC